MPIPPDVPAAEYQAMLRCATSRQWRLIDVIDPPPQFEWRQYLWMDEHGEEQLYTVSRIRRLH